MKAHIKLAIFRCLRCGHEWLPEPKRHPDGTIVRDFSKKPKVCPKCKSPYWNVPRGQKRGPKKGTVYKPREQKEEETRGLKRRD